MFFSFYTAKKKITKRKSSSQNTIRALRFSSPAGLSELGLWQSPQTCRQAFNRRQLRCSL